jgi:outer membrane protein insertion porin family
MPRRSSSSQGPPQDRSQDRPARSPRSRSFPKPNRRLRALLGLALALAPLLFWMIPRSGAASLPWPWKPWKKSAAPTQTTAPAHNDNAHNAPRPGDSIQVRFEGNRSFSEKKLRAALEEPLRQIRNEGLTRPNVDDCAYYLSAFYQNQGFARVEIETQTRPDQLLLKIREGHAFHLRHLRITGNRSLPEKDIKGVLISATTDRFENSASRLPFVLDDLQRGCSRLIDWYQLEGFLNVDVDSPEISFSEASHEADAQVEIHEGPRFSFGTVEIRGTPYFDRATLLKALAPLLNTPYSAPKVAALQSQLQKFYGEHAHFEAQIDVVAEAQEANEKSQVPVRIEIHAGPQYRFQGIDFNGLRRTQPDWLRARLASLEGQPYHPETLEAKTRRLMGSGLFSSLQITPSPQPDHTLRLKVSLEEAKARELGFSLGYGSYEGAIFGVRAAHRNLLGRGLHFSTDLVLSQRNIGLESTLSNPWLFEIPTEFVTRAFIRNRFELGYDKREAGVRGELSRKLFPFLRTVAFAQTRTVEITQTQIQGDLMGSTAYQIGTVGLSATLDRRDDPLNPTRGWIAAGILDSNFLRSGASFLRSSARLGWHYPLPADIGFAASARLGFLSGKTNLPLDERFFLGGPTTIRSFRERRVGSRDLRFFPVGGNAYSLLNLETDFPLLQNLRGALFFDAGCLASDASSLPVDDFRTAIGIGMRYALPIGPLRFDLGFNPDRRPYESWGAVHVSFGFAF